MTLGRKKQTNIRLRNVSVMIHGEGLDLRERLEGFKKKKSVRRHGCVKLCTVKQPSVLTESRGGRGGCVCVSG